MIKLTIDSKAVEVEEGNSILDAANKLGINIPTMCHLKGYSNHPSCMVCVVKDIDKGTLQPSCAFPAQSGMNISTKDTEVLEARKDALELLLSDHVGDCEAPCRVACPAFMDIPAMNRAIALGNSARALQVIKEEIALPIVLGYICQAPCEKACRRKPIDVSISICQLKKYAAVGDFNYLPEKAKPTGTNIAIIGSGVAGLSSAYHLIKLGYQVTVFEKNDNVGGTLQNITSELPADMLAKEIELLEKFGVQFNCNSDVNNEVLQKLKSDYNTVILANGVVDKNWAKDCGFELNTKQTGLSVDKDTFETSIKGIYACGSAVREYKMAVQALANGKLVAFKVHETLSGETRPSKKSYFNSRFGNLLDNEQQAYLVEAKNNDAVKLESKLNIMSEQEAIREAERCMHCDCRKVDNCKLRILANEYGANQRNYKTGERKLLQKYFAHQHVVYEPEKCIRCGLCVDIASKDTEDLGLNFVGRGFDVRIGVPLNETIDKTLTKLAVKCADACPTGALSLK